MCSLWPVTSLKLTASEGGNESTGYKRQVSLLLRLLKMKTAATLMSSVSFVKVSGLKLHMCVALLFSLKHLWEAPSGTG